MAPSGSEVQSAAGKCGRRVWDVQIRRAFSRRKKKTQLQLLIIGYQRFNLSSICGRAMLATTAEQLLNTQYVASGILSLSDQRSESLISLLFIKICIFNQFCFQFALLWSASWPVPPGRSAWISLFFSFRSAFLHVNGLFSLHFFLQPVELVH